MNDVLILISVCNIYVCKLLGCLPLSLDTNTRGVYKYNEAQEAHFV